jgi:hypothetical protein
VANPRANSRADAAAAGISARRSAARTRSIVFGRIREQGQFRGEIHAHVQVNSCSGPAYWQQHFINLFPLREFYRPTYSPALDR